MIEKQLAGIIDDQEIGHIIVDPWIPKAIEKKKGLLSSIFSCSKLGLCKRKKKLKADDDLNSTASTSASSSRRGHNDNDNPQSRRQSDNKLPDDTDDEEDLSNEASVKKIDYIKERNIMIIHSFRKVELYLMPTELCKKARKIQEIQFDEDPNVFRCFAYNPNQLLFGLGKNILGFVWDELTQIFQEQLTYPNRDQIVQVCGNVEDSQDSNIKNGFIIRTSKNYLYLVRFQDGKVVVKGQTFIDDNKAIFEKERNFIFYHKNCIILIRWQANYQSDHQRQNSQTNTPSQGIFSNQTRQLNAAVMVTIYECNPKIINNDFFGKPQSYRLELNEFEVIQEIDEAYILPQKQNDKNRIALVCQNKTFLLVFGYKDGVYLLDKAAHNKQKLNFDINNNIIVGVKENGICEISTFNDSGSYESVIHNSTQSIFLQAQSCVDVQENFLLPIEGDNVVAIEQIKSGIGFEYYFLVQEPTEFEDEEEQDDEEESEEEKQNDVRNRSKKRKNQDSEDEDDYHDSDDDRQNQRPQQNNKQKNKEKQNINDDQKKGDKKNYHPQKELPPNKISERIIFSIYKMKLVTPKEKLRYLISEEMDIEPTMKWFGFSNVINYFNY